MKTSFQKQSMGGGYGINRNVAPDKVLGVAEPPLARVTVRPGTGIVTPGSPKSGHGRVLPAKVISGKK